MDMQVAMVMTECADTSLPRISSHKRKKNTAARGEYVGELMLPHRKICQNVSINMLITPQLELMPRSTISCSIA